MATILTSFDTVTKELSVTMDGKAVADVTEVFIGRGYGEGGYGCQVTTKTKDEKQDLVTYTHTVAKAEADIHKYFGV
jgi:hypothetical protein